MEGSDQRQWHFGFGRRSAPSSSQWSPSCSRSWRPQQVQSEEGRRGHFRWRPVGYDAEVDGGAAWKGQFSVRSHANDDDANDAEPTTKGWFKEEQTSPSTSTRRRRPWYLLLRQFKQRRPAPRRGDESRGGFEPLAQADSAEAEIHHPGVREGPGGGFRRSGRPGLVTTRLVEEAAVGQIQGAVSLRSSGCHCLRDDSQWRPRCSWSSNHPEPQSQAPSSAGRRRLVGSLAPDRDPGSPVETRMGRISRRNGHHQWIHQLAPQAEEEGERSQFGCRKRGTSRIDGLHGVPPRRGFYPWERGKNSKFLRYYSWLKNVHSTLPVRTGNEEALFPATFPYPEVLSQGKLVDAEAEQLKWSKAAINAWVAWCNFVVLGNPDYQGMECEPRVAYRCGGEIKAFTDQLLGEVREFMSEELCTEELTCSGGRQSLLETLEAVGNLHGSYGSGSKLPDSLTGTLGSAISVVADRVAIPETAGTVDPCAWLPEGRKQLVEDLSVLQLPELLWDEVPRACHRVSLKEEAGLVRKLLKHQMITLVREEDLPRSENGKLLTGGFFCVKKSDSEDRLIYDRRPENATMERLNWSRLPSGACFARLLLEPNEFLRGSGDDLRTYYYSLALPTNWIRFNSVGRRVDPQVVLEWKGDPSVAYRPAMRVLGMGDSNACCIAQGVHEHILEQYGLLSPQTKLIYGSPVPHSKVLEGAYLDDLLVCYKKSVDYPIPLDGSFVPPQELPEDPDMVQVRKAEVAYEQAGLCRALHKSFRAECKFKAWGAEVNGVLGLVGSPVETRRQIWLLIFKVVKEGQTSKGILQRLMGHVCFCFQYRREFYALQHHIYKWMDTLQDSVLVSIPAFILDELRSMALHLPFCTWKMRRQFGRELVATDATPTSGGACRVEVPGALRRELWQQCEIRGEAVRLDRSPLSPDVEREMAPKEPSVFASTVAESLPWRTTASFHFRETAHINLQEARALRREISQLARDPANHNTVQLCLNDSRVVVGAMSKGRSSAFRLNGLIRTMIPYLALTNICLGLLWVETKSNPADYPSRFAALPSPRPPPTWLQQFGISGFRFPGLEVFAGSARLTRMFRAAGIAMLDPVDILWGVDAFETWIDELIVIDSCKIGFLWLAPPCGSFSALRNLDRGGPLRPRGRPEGDPNNPEVELGNALWSRALSLAWLAWKRGIPFFIEHPRNSKAWLLVDTIKLREAPGVFMVEAHWCQYEDRDRVGLPNRKPTRILGTGTWIKPVVKTCHGEHQHGKPLRGSRAKLAGACPWGFCRALATSYLQHYGETAECGSISGLPTQSA